MNQNEIGSTFISGKYAYGIDPKRKVTKYERFKAILYLKWWDFRFWLAKYGLFVKKIYFEEENGK